LHLHNKTTIKTDKYASPTISPSQHLVNLFPEKKQSSIGFEIRDFSCPNPVVNGLLLHFENLGYINDIQVFENIRMFRGDTIEAKYWINCFYEIENDLIQNGITTEILNKTYEDLKNPKNIFSGPAIFSVSLSL